MHYLEGYEVFLRSIDKFSTSQVDIEDYVFFINQAQYLFIDQKAEQFEKTQKSQDELAVLQNELEVTHSDYRILLPENYYRLLLLTCTVQDTSCTDKATSRQVPVLRLDADKEGFVMRNPYYKPSLARWYYKRIQNTLQLYPSAHPLQHIHLTYLEKPPVVTLEMVQQQALSIWNRPHMYAIHALAVAQFLEKDKNPRLSTFPSVHPI